MLKAKILFVGPCESGKTVLANFLTESSDITEYSPTQGVRFESCWPALMKDAHGVVIVFNADIPSHRKEMEMWYSCFVQQQSLQDTQCMLIAHHKPGSGDDKGSLSLLNAFNEHLQSHNRYLSRLLIPAQQACQSPPDPWFSLRSAPIWPRDQPQLPSPPFP
ncbi:intraflagellar transport protein 22 homolog isoform X3 [Callithrix jacchus]|uniref:intraflagellar transport protein 22 homolog isoform X3 n=1 Tax=Callithrix jacchus TaxID=9483 RepID=UPI0023DD54AF|nr:intraflagellar transport protein 22 homolog isoform X3 [Callithrix jacchus]